MPLSNWLNIGQLIVFALLIPTAKVVVSTVISLRDATRDLTQAAKDMSETLKDHETRLRRIESWPFIDRRAPRQARREDEDDARQPQD